MRKLTIYFTDRKMNVLGMASSHLPNSLRILDDLESEEINTGGTVLECTVSYAKQRFQTDKSLYRHNCIAVGNYVLFENEQGQAKFYTIISTQKDAKASSISFYAEDAGLDLLNSIVGKYEADKAYPISWYIEKFAAESGWVLGQNEIEMLTRKLSWDGEETVTKRLLSVCTQFDHAELSYSIDIDGLQVTNKYINIHKKRGSSTDVTLRIDRDIDNIISTESIENLGTALYVTGGTQEGADFPITLDGYSLTSEQSEGGRFKIIKNKDGQSILCDTKANQIWSRFVALQNDVGDLGYITKTYSYDTLSKSELCNRALTQLKRISNPEQNFEVAISKLPDTVRIGDRINIVDVDDELYLEARVLKLEKSRCKDEATATLGEYLIKSSGISDKLQILADEIKRGQKQLEIVASNGTKVFTGDQEPENPKKGDIWFQQNEDGTVDTVKWNGAKWDIVARDLENKEFEKQLNAALQDVADAKAAAEEAYEKGIEAIAKGKEAAIAAEKADQKAEEVKGQLQDAYEKSEAALVEAGKAVAKVDNQEQVISEAKEIAQQASSNAEQAKTDAKTAQSDAGKAIKDADSALKEASGVREDLTTEVSRLDGLLTTKVSQTEYNTLKGTVSSQGTQITQNKQAIELKADSKTVDTLTGRVTTAEGKITTQAGQIALKADTKTVDTLTGRVSTAEGKITTMAGQIELKASKSEVDTVKGSVTALDSKLTVESGKIAGLVTKTDGHSTEIANLKLKNNEFSVNLSKVETDFNNLQIGGRNLLKGTAKFTSNAGVGVADSATYLGNTVLKNTWTTGNRDTYSLKTTIVPTAKQYTVSFYARADRNMTFHCYFYSPNTTTQSVNSDGKTGLGTDGATSMTATTSWKKFWITWTQTAATETKTVLLGRIATAGTFYISSPMLVEGNTPANWTPAPEDLTTVTEFSSLKQTVTSLQTTVGNKAEQSQVTQLAGQITSVVSTVDGHTSQITQLGNQIDLKVSKNGVVSSINVSPETVRINAKWIHLSGTSLIDNAVIGTAHLKDASITNAKIASLSADKITSGSIDAGKINVLNLNADNIKSGKISALDIVGSKIVNTFDTTINSARVTGTTTLEKAELAIQYNLPATSQSGKISINPLSISGRVNKSTGAIQNMWELSAGALLLNDGMHSGTLMAKSLVDNQWWYLGLNSWLSWHGNPDNAYRPRTKLVYIQNKQAMRTSGIITRPSGGGGGNWQGIGKWAASSAGFNLVRDISVIATIQNGTSATISFQRGGDVAVRCPQDWTELRWDAFVGVED